MFQCLGNFLVDRVTGPTEPEARTMSGPGEDPCNDVLLDLNVNLLTASELIARQTRER
jgi:hypothetical protein